MNYLIYALRELQYANTPEELDSITKTMDKGIDEIKKAYPPRLHDKIEKAIKNTINDFKDEIMTEEKEAEFIEAVTTALLFIEGRNSNERNNAQSNTRQRLKKSGPGTRHLLGGKHHTKKRRSSSIRRKHRNKSSRVRK